MPQEPTTSSTHARTHTHTQTNTHCLPHLFRAPVPREPTTTSTHTRTHSLSHTHTHTHSHTCRLPHLFRAPMPREPTTTSTHARTHSHIHTHSHTCRLPHLFRAPIPREPTTTRSIALSLVSITMDSETPDGVHGVQVKEWQCLLLTCTINLMDQKQLMACTLWEKNGQNAYCWSADQSHGSETTDGVRIVRIKEWQCLLLTCTINLMEQKQLMACTLWEWNGHNAYCWSADQFLFCVASYWKWMQGVYI